MICLTRNKEVVSLWWQGCGGISTLVGYYFVYHIIYPVQKRQDVLNITGLKVFDNSGDHDEILWRDEYEDAEIIMGANLLDITPSN